MTWLAADVLSVALPEQAYDLWHDRAVFHFLTDPADAQPATRTRRRGPCGPAGMPSSVDSRPMDPNVAAGCR